MTELDASLNAIDDVLNLARGEEVDLWQQAIALVKLKI